MNTLKMQETVGYVLAQLCKVHRNSVNAALNTVGLHVGQEMVLLHLWQQGGVTQSELADGLAVEAPTVTRMLQRMERAGLVERRSDPQDARLSRVYATTRGVEIQEQIEEAWAALEMKLLAGLTTEEIRFLRRMLVRMYYNLAD